MTSLVALVAQAADAGLRIDRGPGGALVVRGPRSAGSLVGAILARKAETLTLVDVFNGRGAVLNWQHAAMAEPSGRCVLCRRRALLRDPFDGQPMHKTCAERAISSGNRPANEGADHG